MWWRSLLRQREKQDPRSPATSSSSSLFVRWGHAPGFGQTRGQDPHELRRRRRPQPWTARSPGGASRSSATGRVGGLQPSPTRRRGPRQPPRPQGLSRVRRGGGTADASCAAGQLERRRRLCEAHGDRKVVGGGAIPLEPPTFRPTSSAYAAECLISRRPTISAHRQLARPPDSNRPNRPDFGGDSVLWELQGPERCRPPGPEHDPASGEGVDYPAIGARRGLVWSSTTCWPARARAIVSPLG